MKKLFATLWTVFVFIGGTSSSLAAGETEFETGVALFKQADYRQALSHFDAARGAGMDEPRLDYNMGVCYYRLGRYSQAKQAFQRAERHPPMRELARYNIALVESARGRNGEAERLFRQVYNETDNAKLKQLAAVKLGMASTPKTKSASSRWFGGFSLSAGYDDNIEDPTQTGVADKGDNFASLLLYTSGLLQGDYANGLRLGVNGYFLRYQDVSAYDINLIQLNLDKTFVSGAWKDKIGLGAEHTTFGGNDYLGTAKFTLSGERPLSAMDSLRLRYRYSDITSLDTAYDKLEGSRHEAEVRWQRDTGRRQFRATYEYELNDRTDLDTGTSFISYSPTRHTFELRASMEPAPAWELGGRASYRRSVYADPNVIAGVSAGTREDDRLFAGVKLGRKLSRSLTANLEYKYTDNDSNIDSYDYTRNLYSIGLAGSF